MALCKLQIELNRINMSAVNKTFLKFNRMDETSCVRLLIRAFFHDNDVACDRCWLVISKQS